MSPAIIALSVSVTIALVATMLLDIHELRHIKIQRTHARGRRYTPPVTIVVTADTFDEQIRALGALAPETYPSLTIIAVVHAPHGSGEFRSVSRAAKASPHRVITIANARRRPLTDLLPRHISKGLVLHLPATHRLLPGGIAAATAYFRNPRTGNVVLRARATTPQHIGSALTALYHLMAHRTEPSHRFARDTLTRYHSRPSSHTEWTALPALEAPATIPRLPLPLALTSLTIPLLVLLSVLTAPHELTLTLLCIAGPFIYLGLRMSRLLGVPTLARASVALLTPVAAALASVYWAVAHLDTRHI